MSKVKNVLSSPFRFFFKVCTLIGFITLTCFLFTCLLVFDFFHSLPDIENKTFASFKQQAEVQVQKKLMSSGNLKLYRWVNLDEVNRELLYALVMAEDSSYFEHNGVNFNALIDSLATNIRKREYDMGASTITQQVVKNVFLNHEKSLIRKLKEILIARKLEAQFSKNEILEIYLNIAEFGPDMFGIGMSSQHFFKRTPANVSALEGAYLSLMLTSPRKNYFSIHKNKYLSPSSLKKIHRVLRDMHHLEYLSPKQFREYNKLPFLTDYSR